MGDKAYYSKPRIDELKEHGVEMPCKRQKNHKDPLSPEETRFGDHYRQRIEPINSQLSERFGADRHHAKTPAGPEARMRSKLLGNVPGVYL